MASVPGMNFMQKPERGWLHSDSVIRGAGVAYCVRYVGCIEVLASMKMLDFDTRFIIAKECIRKVCETAGFRTGDKHNKIDKRISSWALGNLIKSDYAGCNIKLNISSNCISLKTVEGNQTIAVHDMPKISFASGGDSEYHDFVAYVAKDDRDGRACYVLECSRGSAQDVITTIGQAFELRFKDYFTGPIDPDREYYNDLPGKVPPDVVPSGAPRERLPSTNLIDLNSEVPPPVVHEYVNDPVVTTRRDVFDLVDEGLQKEDWFHGGIDRVAAENLLLKDGDFLVRESTSSRGQYILTGLQGNTKKHLLLIDPEGVVRTKDRRFDSVSHLINYHYNNQLPIISAESALVLRNPVSRHH